MRQYFCKKLENAILSDPIYPICKINGNNLYDEQIMSMPTIIEQQKREINPSTPELKKGTYFFFIFNFENYYHFLYDTLPYLVHYFKLKQENVKCKLLIPENHIFLQFQIDIFNLLNITEKEYEFAKNNMSYEVLYLPSSLTHGKLISNSLSASIIPPSIEAFNIWNKLLENSQLINTPKKIYISRRTWIHNDFKNIGTNYTTRRRCVNEDNMVKLLKEYGYEEVFCENITMNNKISYFNNATHIIGLIGGGMANLLFSNKETKVGCIVTPDFLNINKRFSFSMNHTNIKYLNIASHSPYEGKYPLFSRIKVIDETHIKFDKIGEIESYINGLYVINMSNNDIAGFSFNKEFEKYEFTENQIVAIDSGLNSPFSCDLNDLRKYLDEELENEGNYSNVR
jgi:capsular polysaccharide biosynthesis protein